MTGARRPLGATPLRTWTREQEAAVIAGMRANRTPVDIAAELGLDRRKVQHKVMQLYLRHADLPEVEDRTAMRKCLGGCNRSFESHGPGNRVCTSCKEKNAGVGI